MVLGDCILSKIVSLLRQAPCAMMLCYLGTIRVFLGFCLLAITDPDSGFGSCKNQNHNIYVLHLYLGFRSFHSDDLVDDKLDNNFYLVDVMR